MIVQQIAKSGNDEFYTPEYAIEPLLNYVNDRGYTNIWCPFDTEDSLYVNFFREKGLIVKNTHIDNGIDFFTTEPPAECDIIISNPPYSCKGAVFERLFHLGIPFAMLVGVVGLFESKKRFNMFKNNDFEIMYFDKRISYFKSYSDQKPSLNPPFSSVYITKNLLPSKVCFSVLNKK